MVFEASALDFSLPFCHAALELLIVPFGFFTSFSIPCMLIPCLGRFTQLFFMFCWIPLTIIDDEPCRIPFRFLPWTNLPCWKLKLDRPISGLRINHPRRCRLFRRCVINGRWSNCRLWRCCSGYRRRLRSCLSCINNVSHLCHPTRHRT